VALGDDPLAALAAAVLGDGRDADQAGELAPVEDRHALERARVTLLEL
jgi:hypothetical protein